MASRDKSEIQVVVDRIEEVVEVTAEKVERGLINWVRNDQFFNGFRNTYARILIIGLTWAALYVLGAWAFLNPDQVGWYIVALVLLTGMNQLSVRFAFNVDYEKDLTDEYQATRRDSAYRRAYRKVSSQLVAGYMLFFGLEAIVQLQNSNFAGSLFELIDEIFPAPGQLHLTLSLNLNQIIVLATFYISLFGLQKYMSWGFKGEPWADSARKKGSN